MATKRETVYKLTNLLSFLQNLNVVVIRDNDEYERFHHILARHGILELIPGKTLQTYPATISLFEKANVGTPGMKFLDWDGKTLYAECQIGKRSIGIYPYTERAVVEWYGERPMSVDDVDDPGSLS